MKKSFRSLRLIILASVCGLAISACGSQMERDAEKLAKRAVEFELSQKRQADRSNIYGRRMSNQEWDKYCRDYIEYAKKMSAKYGETRDERKVFSDMVDEKIKELKKR